MNQFVSEAARLYGLIVFPAAMILAAVSDVATLKISNRLIFAAAAAFLPAALLAQLHAQDIALHFAAAAVALAAGITAFSLRIMGGGDGKLLSAYVLWFGPADVIPFVIAFSLAGGAIALSLWLIRRFPMPADLERFAWVARLWQRVTGVPYALAFAAGGLAVYPHSKLWSLLLNA